MKTMTEKKRDTRKSRNPWPARLRAIRAEHGLTQKQAAEKVGTVLRTWQNWEYGRRRPGAATAKLIQILFGF